MRGRRRSDRARFPRLTQLPSRREAAKRYILPREIEAVGVKDFVPLVEELADERPELLASVVMKIFAQAKQEQGKK